jgi:parallel beta-helix repeat protein
MLNMIKNLRFLLSICFILFFSSFTLLSLNTAISSEDTYPAEAPVVCVGEVIKTVCASGCDYTTIQEAVNASQPGWTIQVKNGIYTSGGQKIPTVDINNKSGTQTKPICLQNYPGHNPIIDPSGTGDGVNAQLGQHGINIFNSKWWIIEGFEIRGGWEGIKIQPQSSGSSSNITIRRNHIHDNQWMGMNLQNAVDLFIEGNDIHENGFDPDECDGRPEQCHNIYVKNTTLSSVIPARVTIRGNYLHTTRGAAIQVYDRGTEILIENNLIVDAVWGIILSGTDYSTIRNNTIVYANPPTPDPKKPFYVAITGKWGSSERSNNKIINNIFYTAASSFYGYPVYMLETPDDPDLDTWTVDHNLWYAPANTKWIWKDKSKTDFNSEYKQTTGWDKNGPPIPSDPLFVDSLTGDYHLSLSSPAINKGDNLNFSQNDFDGKLRDTKPDIGAFEY